MKSNFLCFVLVYFCFELSAQTFEQDYFPIKSSGIIPEDFTNSTKKKINDDLSRIDLTKTTVNGNREYTILTNYAVAQQLHGGNILLNDELTIYVNKVADELLKHDNELRSQLKIYVTKVPEVNAYCMGKGYIFINLGLLSKIKSEAQLAFILAHEITHYTQKHSLKTYYKVDRIKKEKYRKKTFGDRVIELYQFSKDNEMEADSLGFRLFEKSNYSLSDVYDVFDVLQYSYLPFDETPFDTTFFNDKYYKIPSKYFLSSTQGVKINEDYDDSYRTHPNIKKRKKTVDSLLTRTVDKSGKLFIVSETDFQKVQTIAKFESCRLYMVERNYLHSIVSAYNLLKKYPENIFLQKIIAKSLFAMFLYKTGELKYDDASFNKGPIPDFTKTEGCSQQLNFLLDKMPTEELAILAIKYNLNCSESHKHELVFKNIADSIMYCLPKDFNLDIKDFSQDSISKVYYQNAFIDYFKKNADFKDRFEQASSVTKNNKVTQSLKIYNPNEKRTKSKKNDGDELNGKRKLAISSIVVVDPFYKIIDDRNAETYLYNISDRRETDFIKNINEIFKKSSISLQIVDPSNFSSSDIDNFNSYSVLQDWSNERLDGGEEQCNYVFSTEESDVLVKNYGTKFFMWTGVVAYTEAQKGLLTSPLFYTIYYSLVVDIQTGEIVYKNFHISDKSDSSYRAQNLIEETVRAIKN